MHYVSRFHRFLLVLMLHYLLGFTERERSKCVFIYKEENICSDLFLLIHFWNQVKMNCQLRWYPHSQTIVNRIDIGGLCYRVYFSEKKNYTICLQNRFTGSMTLYHYLKEESCTLVSLWLIPYVYWFVTKACALMKMIY